jgi:hypothetical protein
VAGDEELGRLEAERLRRVLRDSATSKRPPAMPSCCIACVTARPASARALRRAPTRAGLGVEAPWRCELALQRLEVGAASSARSSSSTARAAPAARGRRR